MFSRISSIDEAIQAAKGVKEFVEDIDLDNYMDSLSDDNKTAYEEVQQLINEFDNAKSAAETFQSEVEQFEPPEEEEEETEDDEEDEEGNN